MSRVDKRSDRPPRHGTAAMLVLDVKRRKDLDLGRLSKAERIDQGLELIVLHAEPHYYGTH